MAKIVVMTDIHANLPALEAALKAVRAEGYDLLVQTGDVIAIGPYPRECLDMILSTPRVENIRGNHEGYFLDGIPAETSAGEVEHQKWVRAQLTEAHRAAVAGWPFRIEHDFEGVKAVFQHSGLGASGREIQGIPRDADGAALDRLFGATLSPKAGPLVVFYGHRHEEADVQGAARYINPGSLGCGPTAVARFCVVRFEKGKFAVERRAVGYADEGLRMAFEERQVPEREFIGKAFFGGRI